MSNRSPLFVILVALLSLFTASCSSTAKQPAGLRNGTLSPCPASPNCVLSEQETEQETGGAYIKPLSFSVAPDQAWTALKKAIERMGGTIEQADGLYLWATFRSTIMRFVDDVECRMVADQGVIHLRSASRVGYSDFGVNRKRMEKLRQVFTNEIEK